MRMSSLSAISTMSRSLPVSLRSMSVNKIRANLAAIDAAIEELKSAAINYEMQFQKATETLPLVQERLSGLELLEDRGLARTDEFHDVRQRIVETRLDVVATTASTEQAKARVSSRLSKRGEIKATAEADILQRRADALRRMAAFEQQIEKEQRRQSDRLLRAPIAGTVVGMAVSRLGASLQSRMCSCASFPRAARSRSRCSSRTRTLVSWRLVRASS